MDIRSLIPWNRSKSVPVSRLEDEGVSFLALHREMNRLFDDFFRGFDLQTAGSAWSSAWPQVDVSDSGKEIKITAELPGLDEKDVELTLQNGVLTIRGEKHAESDGPQYSERWHGSFQRSLQLGDDIDPEKVSASFKKGLLTVNIAKKPEAYSEGIRIPINA
jgi:HSP20 family protein